jgi:hypothetical protein
MLVDAISAFTSETPSSAGFDKGSEVEKLSGLTISNNTNHRCFDLGHEYYIAFRLYSREIMHSAITLRESYQSPLVDFRSSVCVSSCKAPKGSPGFSDRAGVSASSSNISTAASKVFPRKGRAMMDTARATSSTN